MRECVCVPCLQLVLIIGLTHALVVFRVVAAVSMAEANWDFLRDHSSTVAVMLGAVLHYVTIQVMTRVIGVPSADPVGQSRKYFVRRSFESILNSLSLSIQVNKYVAFKICDIGKCEGTLPRRPSASKTVYSELCTQTVCFGPLQRRPARLLPRREASPSRCSPSSSSLSSPRSSTWRSSWEGTVRCVCGYRPFFKITFQVSLTGWLNPHRMNGYPGHYVRIAGKWRLEEVRETSETRMSRSRLVPTRTLSTASSLVSSQCHPSGCLTDLFIQMAVIMLLKQTLNNVFEFTGP